MSEKTHAVLLLHGLGGGPAEMTYLKKRLTEEGFYVEVPLLPGHGTHYTDLTKVKWEALAEAATLHFLNLKSRY